jgi:hypothetical protein
MGISRLSRPAFLVGDEDLHTEEPPGRIWKSVSFGERLRGHGGRKVVSNMIAANTAIPISSPAAP